ncbi:hypothetical protein RN001_009243 [Aquatica leii]|uniref:Right handed beta helix domain-containing protein n=1 Tax=Aquatica leii TaxID=1421715 RepID=A0AAN7SDQ9_9COLE|nr:hypothetical protein RN001_009243 [Aquatica leii]
MGVQWCFSLIFWLVLGMFVIKSVPAVIEEGASGSTTDACRIPGCNCSDAAKTWNIINCTFNSSQKVEFTPTSIPANTLEVSIIGGGQVIFQPYTFNNLGFQFLRIDNAREFLIRKNAFLDLSSASLIVQVLSSDRVIIETNAFKNMQTPISMDISRCSYVSIQNSAFSRLQDGKFRNIAYLDLAEGAFLFENQGMIGRHGPVTSLSFHNVIMPKIPTDTFHSSLAEVSIKNSEIREIHTDAFRASQISAVLFINSSIHKIHSGAFSDRTLLVDFRLSKCKVHLLESRAVMASMANLTVEHSKITEIQRGAINGSTVAKAIITDNEIGTFHSKGFVLNNWNRINIDNNIIKRVCSLFLEVPYNPDIQHVEFTFVGNEIYRIEPNALSFMPDLQYTVLKLKFDNNFFNLTCHCDIDKWVLELLGNPTQDTSFVLNSSFCIISSLLARCFELQEGLINMHNFTQLVCGVEDSIKCEPYSGETKVLDTTTIIDTEDVADSNSGLILGLVLGALLVIAVSGTIVILLIRGGLWLKRKGYCMRFRNLHYRPDHPSPEEEGTIVAIASRDKLDVPEELTPEILQRLREQLEDPTTHDDAREMIERLYELFITGDSYTNNNRQDEEAHLYEELGNLQNPHEQEKRLSETEPFGFLRMMEEKYNTTALAILGAKPALVEEYSEPTDAAVHLYSELQNKTDECVDLNKRDSLKSFQSNTQRSNHSRNIAFRPLPEKPKSSYDSEAGPSKKL